MTPSLRQALLPPGPKDQLVPPPCRFYSQGRMANKLILQTWCCIILQTKDEKSLLKEALPLSETLGEHNSSNKALWGNKYKQLPNIMTLAQPRNQTSLKTRTCRRKVMINKIKSSFHEFWLKKKNSEPKMRSYVKYKTTFCLEDYLTATKEVPRPSSE